MYELLNNAPRHFFIYIYVYVNHFLGRRGGEGEFMFFCPVVHHTWKLRFTTYKYRNVLHHMISPLNSARKHPNKHKTTHTDFNLSPMFSGHKCGRPARGFGAFHKVGKFRQSKKQRAAKESATLHNHMIGP